MRFARGTVAGLLLGSAMIMATIMATPALAQQMPQSCQKDFVPLMEKRQKFLEQINGFNKRKPTAPVACSAFSGLSGANKKLAEWMTAQKDWCQVPDDMLNGITGQQGQIDKVRGQACNAAAQYSKALKQAKSRAAQAQRQQQGGGVGSGVRLPQGAL